MRDGNYQIEIVFFKFTVGLGQSLYQILIMNTNFIYILYTYYMIY